MIWTIVTLAILGLVLSVVLDIHLSFRQCDCTWFEELGALLHDGLVFPVE